MHAFVKADMSFLKVSVTFFLVKYASKLYSIHVNIYLFILMHKHDHVRDNKLFVGGRGLLL